MAAGVGDRFPLKMRLADRFLGTTVVSSYGRMANEETLSRTEMIRRQGNLLRRTLTHAYETTLHYRRLFRSLNLFPSNIQAVEDLSKILILQKFEPKANQTEFESTRSGRFRIYSTGGSTGAPLKYNAS